MTTRFPGGLAGLVELARGTRWEQVARDESALEETLVRAMAASADPTTREIGSGLADGTMTWRTVATSSAYAEYVDQSLDAVRDFDFNHVAERLTEEKADAERAEVARQERDDEDDAEPLWQGIGRDRR